MSKTSADPLVALTYICRAKKNQQAHSIDTKYFIAGEVAENLSNKYYQSFQIASGHLNLMKIVRLVPRDPSQKSMIARIYADNPFAQIKREEEVNGFLFLARLALVPSHKGKTFRIPTFRFYDSKIPIGNQFDLFYDDVPGKSLDQVLTENIPESLKSKLRYAYKNRTRSLKDRVLQIYRDAKVENEKPDGSFSFGFKKRLLKNEKLSVNPSQIIVTFFSDLDFEMTISDPS